jgi:hypothetical protein
MLLCQSPFLNEQSFKFCVSLLHVHRNKKAKITPNPNRSKQERPRIDDIRLLSTEKSAILVERKKWGLKNFLSGACDKYLYAKICDINDAC